MDEKKTKLVRLLAPIEPKPPAPQINIPANSGWLKKPLPPIQQKKPKARISEPLIDPRGKQAIPPIKNNVDIMRIDAEPLLDDEANYVRDLIKDIEDEEAKKHDGLWIRNIGEARKASHLQQGRFEEAMDSQEYRMFVIESAFKTRNYPWTVEEVETFMSLVPEENHETIKKLWFENDKHNIADNKLQLFTKILPEEVMEQMLRTEVAPAKGVSEPAAQKVDPKQLITTNNSQSA